jgi:hypothetical protein
MPWPLTSPKLTQWVCRTIGGRSEAEDPRRKRAEPSPST